MSETVHVVVKAVIVPCLVDYKEIRITIPHLLDQTPLSITHRYQVVAASPTVLDEIVTALEY